MGIIHASSEEKAAEAVKELTACYTIVPEKVERAPFIKGIVR